MSVDAVDVRFLPWYVAVVDGGARVMARVGDVPREEGDVLVAVAPDATAAAHMAEVQNARLDARPGPVAWVHWESVRALRASLLELGEETGLSDRLAETASTSPSEVVERVALALGEAMLRTALATPGLAAAAQAAARRLADQVTLVSPEVQAGLAAWRSGDVEEA